MKYGKRTIECLMHFFNFFFGLGGLANLIIGVSGLIEYNDLENLDKNIPKHILPLLITLIVFGSIIVFIAFLGCCGVIRESYCMLVTFAALLLTILIIQVIVAIYTSVANSDKIDKGSIALIVIEVAIELINIIFAICLANSIKNAKRRGNFV